MKEAKDLIKGDPLILDRDEIFIVEDRTELPGGQDSNEPAIRLSVRKVITGEVSELYVNTDEEFDIADLEIKSAKFLYYDCGKYFFTDLDTCEMLMIYPEDVDDFIVFPEDGVVYEMYMWELEPYYIKVAEQH